jgi:transcriptional regulator with XRE-family HTH domain
MRCHQGRWIHEGRWEHSREARHGVEQRGYDLIGSMLKRQRLNASLTQRELESLTTIDQTVISRLENGKQYGLRWSRFATLVGVLNGLDGVASARPTPWWVKLGITPPAYRLETLREQGLLPAAPTAAEPDDNDDPDTDDPDELDFETGSSVDASPPRT